MMMSNLPLIPNQFSQNSDPKEERVEDFAQILLAIKSSTPEIDDHTVDHPSRPPLQTHKKTTLRKNEDDYQAGDSSQDDETFSDEDELYEEADSDEEWVESPLDKLFDRKEDEYVPVSHSGRAKRKKAPSGSACEKHKRWKKRCPDDCPMRKAKFRRIESRTEEKKLNQHRPPNSHSKVLPSAPEIKPEEKKPTKATINNALSALSVLHATADFEESLAGQEGTDKPSGPTQRERKTVEPVLPTTKEENVTQTCKKHLQMNLRCPPTCTKRSTRTPPSPSSLPPSPISIVSTTDDKSSEFKGRRSITKRAFPHMDLQQQQRTKRLKYLPRSCERHKLLHAKCPADCPDRIQRDQQESKLLDKSTEKMHWKKKMVQIF